MAELYKQVFDTENIELAIATCLKDENDVAGPDGIHIHNLIDKNGKIIDQAKIIKEVKMRLRRCRRLNSKTVDNNFVMNLYDRIAYQAVYQIVQPVIESNFSKNNYAFMYKANIKIPISKMIKTVINAKYIYAIKMDFSQYLNIIPLETAIGMIKKLGINNSKLLSTIKHLMYNFKTYDGIGINKKTNLGFTLINCFFHQLDEWIENNIDTISRYMQNDFNLHKDNFVEWLQSINRKCSGKYFRYFDIGVILCTTRSEQLHIYEQLKLFIEQDLKISVTDDTIKLSCNCIDFEKFRIKKKNNSNKIDIIPNNVLELRREIKKLAFRSGYACVDSFHKIVNLLNYYDICNDIEWIIQRINDRMRIHSSRAGSNIKCKKEKDGKKYIYTYKGKVYSINLRELRQKTKRSYKEYLKS